MQRYRLLPSSSGIALEVVNALEDELYRVTPEVAARLYPNMKLPFIVEAERWGFDGVLMRRETAQHVTFTADFSEGRLVAVSRSLHLWRLGFMPEEYPDPHAPLVGLAYLLSQAGFHGFDTEICLSATMVQLVSRFSDADCVRVVEAMRIAARAMQGIADGLFICQSEGGRLYLKIPGEGDTSLYIGRDEIRSAGDASMGGHGIDHAVEQMTFLAGLAEAQIIAERIATT